ncbi:MAG: pyruvate ferredoxin oxidoreductase, partial [Deltaproteobacteria bacterium]|nr:pyruvate ferredoxin oxidoreductase [Deltaproteobacteria bacterium]
MGARKVLALTGNEAAAYAMRQLRPDVVAAYPITPQTDVVQAFATFVHGGVVPTEFVPVESEHSAMSVCVGAAAAGGRVMTASSSQGIALMAEMLLVASGNRLPIVMAVAARSLSAPINIMCDHSDVMLVRDAGWLQLFCTDAQQVYDTTIQAVRIAEHLEVRLPVMVCYDGFITSHALTPVEVLEDAEVQAFVGSYRAVAPLLDVEHPVTYGAMDLRDYFFEHKRQQAEAFSRAADVVTEVGAGYGALTGRAYGLLQAHRLEDAELAVVALGSTASTALGVVDDLRGEGERVGLLH